ncbi:peptide-N(4)-(N-acetyl-beta-glucosaminyl)asparagine amidase-like [Hibiscus syriacus]|uniref:peptide-N(4)-(N-acetyl-beta- glucosaminyl)asparagine amidase-like n=1 Tax=Hibiscus syriacus TaxID=106335 RepID=UPI0019210F8C|nr:peptide-N(4)-(N-acetyl-beta-glucosaminyl)asparagine amidase-like [Hibiscus syriacus]
MIVGKGGSSTPKEVTVNFIDFVVDSRRQHRGLHCMDRWEVFMCKPDSFKPKGSLSFVNLLGDIGVNGYGRTGCGCNSCSRVTRFPYYNDPLKKQERGIVESGSIASHCTIVLLAMTLVLDFTDHVWTECYSEAMGRWMHLDPCKAIYDRPLLYEKGWKKKLNYVIAIAKDGVYDVTKRYTWNWNEVLSRRTITRESSLVSVLTSMIKECRSNFTSQILSVLEDCDKIEMEALDRDLLSTDDAPISLPGRQSGDKQ